MSSLADKRFAVITGKGGVGKTTVAAAEAMALAQRGKRVLVAMCNAKERLSALLGAPPVGHEVTRVREGIWAVNMLPEKAIEEYGRLVLHSRALSRAVIDNKYVRAFLRAVPGMQEWSMLGKAWWHTTETLANGSFKYDTVILDAPATGHGLDMMRVPSVILDVVPPGILRRDAERAWTLLRDPVRCTIVLVTVPEEMPTTETLELAQSFEQMGLRAGRVVVNTVLPTLLSPGEREALEGLGTIGLRTPGAAALLAAQGRAVQEKLQGECLSRLARELPITTVILPRLMEEASNPGAVGQLAKLV